MKTITAVILGWSALIAGCAATANHDGDTIPSGEARDDGSEGAITEVNTLLTPLPGSAIEFPPFQLPTVEPGQLGPGVVIEIPVEEPVPEQTPSQTPSQTPAEEPPSGPIDSPPIVVVVQNDVPVVTVPIPVLIEGNPTCEDAYGTGALSMTFEPKRKSGFTDGTYTSDDGLLTVTVDFEKTMIDYSAIGQLLGVIVKGGPHAMAYPSIGNVGDDLATPAGEEISHVTFCYRP